MKQDCRRMVAVEEQKFWSGLSNCHGRSCASIRVSQYDVDRAGCGVVRRLYVHLPRTREREESCPTVDRDAVAAQRSGKDPSQVAVLAARLLPWIAIHAPDWIEEVVLPTGTIPPPLIIGALSATLTRNAGRMLPVVPHPARSSGRAATNEAVIPIKFIHQYIVVLMGSPGTTAIQYRTPESRTGLACDVTLMI